MRTINGRVYTDSGIQCGGEKWDAWGVKEVELLTTPKPGAIHQFVLPTEERGYVRYNCNLGGYYLQITVHSDGRWEFGGCVGWTYLNHVHGGADTIDRVSLCVSRVEFASDRSCDQAGWDHYNGLVNAASAGMAVVWS